MRALAALHKRLLPRNPTIGWTPYLWLVYLAFFFLQYFYKPPTAVETLAIAATLLAFLALHFNAFWKQGWALVPNIAGITLIGIAWAPVNIGAGVFFIYAASFAAFLGPVPRAAAGIALVVATAMVVAWSWQPSPVFWMPAVVFSVLVGIINIHYAAQSRSNAALRLSQEEVRQLARVAERERISRDLHDLLGHTLSVIALKSELAGKLAMREPQRAQREMGEVEQVSRAALAQIREVVSGMRSRGVAGELEHARVALKAAAVTLDLSGEVPSLAPASEAVLAMVVREAVTNVIRHAQASRCRVAFRGDDGGVEVEVHDDGRGGRIVAGSGIEGMRARLTDVGGRLELDSRHGTRVRAWVPA